MRLPDSDSLKNTIKETMNILVDLSCDAFYERLVVTNVFEVIL